MTAKTKADYQRIYFARKKAAGLCYACKLPATHGIRCETHHLAQLERRRKKREAEVRLCPCGAVLGFRRRLCDRCRDAPRKNPSYLLVRRKRAREEYARRKTSGVCTHCGKSPSRAGRIMCADCAAAFNRAIRDRAIRDRSLANSEPATGGAS